MLHSILRILGWVFGLRFAPDHHIRAVLRLGRYHRVRGPGFFWVIPFVEKVDAPIDISIHEETYYFEDVISSDNIPFMFHLTLYYTFFPQPHTPKKEAIAKLVSLPGKKLSLKLREIIRSYTSEELRWLASNFKAELLRSNETRLKIKRDLTRYTQVHLHDWGIIVDDDGVQIRRISAPEKFEDMMLTIEQSEATLQTFEPHTS